MRWFNVVFALISTGSGVALIAIKDIHPLLRAALVSALLLGIVISIPTALDAISETKKKLEQMGVAAAVRDFFALDRKSIRWDISNATASTLQLEFSTSSGAYWPGGDQVYVLAPGQHASYSLRCELEAQTVCFGVWAANTTWGVGHKRAKGCTGCCGTCGGTYSARIAY